MSPDVVGVHEIDADTYHDDAIVAGRPTLSKSVMQVLLDQSPAHAKAKHPRLNPGYRSEEKEAFDLGTAVHRLLLENSDDGIEIVDAANWTTKAAKLAREEARAVGRVPMLAKQWDVVCEMVADVREQIAAFPIDPPLLADGKAEQTIVWEDNGVLCRARLDWLHNDLAACDDIKSTSRSASHEQWSRSVFGFYGDLQCAFYQRGMRAVFGRDIPFRFIAMETYAPFAISVFDVGPDALAIADAKIDWALALWRKCLTSNTWPAYPQRLCTIEAPPWAEAQWLEREAREEMAA